MVLTKKKERRANLETKLLIIRRISRPKFLLLWSMCGLPFTQWGHDLHSITHKALEAMAHVGKFHREYSLVDWAVAKDHRNAKCEVSLPLLDQMVLK